MRASQIIMGTGVSIDIPQCQDEAVFNKAFSLLKSIDRRFSTYKDSSEISKFRRGELKQEELSADVLHVMRECLKFEKQTGGYFSAWYDGKFDPTGYVKGWAIAQVAKAIEKIGHNSYCIGIGGDIIARSKGSKVWTIGLQNPVEKQSIVGKLAAKNIAVATSGNYLRGAHIINPKTKRPANDVLSVTVAGPDIISADVFATAIFIMGTAGLGFIESQPKYSALIINKDGKLLLTPAMSDLLVS